MWRGTGALAITVLLLGAGEAAATDSGRAFRVPPPEPPRYAVAPQTQQLTVAAADGARIFVEVWLPAARDGGPGPGRVPVVAVATPYALRGHPRPDRLSTKRWTDLLVTRGYALANIHLRGTGLSDGCWGSHDAVDADDVSRAVEALAAAPFADGNVALFGKSHDGGAALNAAARGDRRRLAGLRALVAVSPLTSYADFAVMDGVPDPAQAAWITEIDADASYTGRSVEETGLSPLTGGDPGALAEYAGGGRHDPEAAAARVPCRAEQAAGLAGDGRFTPWMAERELPLLAPRITTPTLLTMGLHETQTRQIVGVFDGLRGPKAGLFPLGGHDYPDQNSVLPQRSRGDWEAMVLAWLGHWVRGEGRGVRRWPVAQVADTAGQWRAERSFPLTGGPAGHLALGPEGTLGSSAPVGATTSRDAYHAYWGPSASFETPPLAGPLRLTGQVVADLWVGVDRPLADVQAHLLAIGRDGRAVRGGGKLGARSVRFRDPLERGRFVQAVPNDVPVGRPFRLVVRFVPGDVEVPAGGRLVLVVTEAASALYSGPVDHDPFDLDHPLRRAPGDAGRAAGTDPGAVTIHHDCTHPSMLRFLMPREERDLLDVLEVGQDPASLGTAPPPPREPSDGAGLARRLVCGRPVERDEEFLGPAVRPGGGGSARPSRRP